MECLPWWGKMIHGPIGQWPIFQWGALIAVTVTFSKHHPSANLPTYSPEYCFHFLLIQVPTHQMNTQVPQFIYWAILHPHSVNLPTYFPAYFPHFLFLQVSTCQMNIGPSSSIVPFCISQVLNCLLLLPVWPIIFLIQPNYFPVY